MNANKTQMKKRIMPEFLKILNIFSNFHEINITFSKQSQIYLFRKIIKSQKQCDF